mmetsp:Transcript_31144/g.70041  ORF Transcript_31144/g.70041 Transcript_31144/m.70041 type:complete len:307 (-) Transcript_31144:470-1390(-)
MLRWGGALLCQMKAHALLTPLFDGAQDKGAAGIDIRPVRTGRCSNQSLKVRARAEKLLHLTDHVQPRRAFRRCANGLVGPLPPVLRSRSQRALPAPQRSCYRRIQSTGPQGYRQLLPQRIQAAHHVLGSGPGLGSTHARVSAPAGVPCRRPSVVAGLNITSDGRDPAIQAIDDPQAQGKSGVLLPQHRCGREVHVGLERPAAMCGRPRRSYPRHSLGRCVQRPPRKLRRHTTGEPQGRRGSKPNISHRDPSDRLRSCGQRTVNSLSSLHHCLALGRHVSRQGVHDLGYLWMARLRSWWLILIMLNE